MKAMVNLLVALTLSFAAAAHAQEIVTLPTRPGVTQAYFIARVPANSRAIALLFPGSGGLIRLRSENGQIKFGGDNFLVRSRTEFIKRGVITAIGDAPSDQQSGWGMGDEFRLGEQHFTDMSAVIADLDKRFPGVPLFLIGTSRGTVSAAPLAAKFGSQIAGVVLTSTVFRQTGPRSTERGPQLSGFDFATIKIPLLFVHHVSDQCTATPYADAQRLSDKYPLISVIGGLPPKTDPCDAFSQHGYYGKESETVEEMVNWMLTKPFRSEVK
ncbi:MAG: lysophospholipase [Deltaproteobacteria bacterium]|nr:MAG: lysophospholipase [Deltaproteobacteria bacterium]